MISCNRICNSNVNNNRNNDHQSIIFNEGSNLNESKIEFNCNHECALQSKFDLNRFASCESLYECDSKQVQINVPKIINNNLIRIRSDSCMLLKKHQIDLDKFFHQYEYKINGRDNFSQTLNCSKPFKELDLQDNQVNQPNLEPDMTISCKNTNNYNINHQHHKNYHYNHHHQHAMKNGHQLNKSCKEDACSTDSLTLFDIDGQMIGKNNSQMQLEQLINYHKVINH